MPSPVEDTNTCPGLVQLCANRRWFTVRSEVFGAAPQSSGIEWHCGDGSGGGTHSYEIPATSLFRSVGRNTIEKLIFLYSNTVLVQRFETESTARRNGEYNNPFSVLFEKEYFNIFHVVFWVSFLMPFISLLFYIFISSYVSFLSFSRCASFIVYLIHGSFFPLYFFYFRLFLCAYLSSFFHTPVFHHSNQRISWFPCVGIYLRPPLHILCSKRWWMPMPH